MTVKVFAPAKINLTLHIIGQRPDGFHLIDSLVAFAPVGDWVTIGRWKGRALTVEGPEAGGLLSDGQNLMLKAAAVFQASPDIKFNLVKNLPVSSGVGGGSADAAAVLRGLSSANADRIDPRRMDAADLQEITDLGADIPMCLRPETLRARGVGDVLDRVSLPPLPAVLVNPRVAVPTGQVFERLTDKSNPPMEAELPAFAGFSDFCDWLENQRNDLQPAALSLCPAVANVLADIAQLAGCRLARMSGSGATCFGLFETLDDALAAKHQLQATRPNWWSDHGILGDCRELAEPQIS